MIDLEATLQRVRVANPPLEDESDEQYAARTLHLAYMLIEHEPSKAIMKPIEESNEETN